MNMIDIYHCLEIIDETDTYIVRDVLTDDLIFVTPEHILNNGNGDTTLYDNDVNSKKQIKVSKILFFYE
jgi:hypothetical protein